MHKARNPDTFLMQILNCQGVQIVIYVRSLSYILLGENRGMNELLLGRYATD